jgi:hypothetical protein
MIPGESSHYLKTMQARLTGSTPFHSVIRSIFQGIRDTSFLGSLIGMPTEFFGPQHIHTETEMKIHVPRHLPLKTCGFVTLHTTRETLRSSTTGGHTALFWERRREAHSADEWGIFAMINLPLLQHRTPQVHYDGNRFIALGQDHFGLIVLIYQVHSTLESLSSAVFESKAKNIAKNQSFRRGDVSVGREASGGVYNFTAPNTDVPRVIFANRVRHSALDVLEQSKCLQMTCNERFVVLRTMKGNCLQHEGVTSSCQDDGLLIFDLHATTAADV